MSSRARLLSLILASSAFTSNVRAEDMAGILEVLEENVVSGASRSAESASEAPAMSSTVTGEQLRRFGIHRLGDALNFLGLGMFSHDRLSTPEVGARGVALTRDLNSHVLVVLDGMVVNEQGGGSAFLHDIPLDIVDHIEIVLGPGSVLYGAQAMLGVINVITKDPKHVDGVRAAFSLGASPPVSARGELKSPDDWHGLGHDNHYFAGLGRHFTLFGLPAGVSASIDYTEFEGPELEFDRQPAPLYDFGPNANSGTWGGPVREQWYQRTVGAYTRLELGALRFTTRATVSRLGTPQLDLFENRAPAAYDLRQNSNSYTLLLSELRADHRFTENLTGLGRAYFGYSGRENERTVIGHDRLIAGVPLGVVDPEQCPLGPTGPCRKEALFYSRWVGLELQANYDWFSDAAFRTLLGVDGRLRTAAYEFVTFDATTGQSFGSDPALTRWHGGGNAMANEQALGAYLQQTARPWPFLTFNAGVRVDVDSRIDSKYLADAISPRAAIIATPARNVSLKLIYSRAFRAPSFLELNIVNGRLLPNAQGIQPETVDSYEAIASFRAGPSTMTVGAFYASWQNLIELKIVKANAPSVSRYENVADVRNYGSNVSMESSLLEGRLRLGLNGTFALAERLLSADQQRRNAEFGVGETVPLTVAPRLYGNAHGAYNLLGDTHVALAAGYFGRRIADQAYYGGDTSNFVPRPEAPPALELRAALTGPVFGLSAASYTLGGNYAFARTQPYVIGPNQGLPRYLVGTPTDAELAPVNRLSLFAGLRSTSTCRARTFRRSPDEDADRRGHVVRVRGLHRGRPRRRDGLPRAKGSPRMQSPNRR